jgi:hypothetical protein
VFIEEALKIDGKIYSLLDSKSAADKKILDTLLTYHPNYFQAIPSYLLTNELKLIAIKSCPNMIKHIGLKFIDDMDDIDDKEFVLAAIRDDPTIYRHLPKKWKIKESIMIAAAARNVYSLKIFPAQFYGKLFSKLVKDILTTKYNFTLFLLASNLITNSLQKLNVQEVKSSICDFSGVKKGRELLELYIVSRFLKL